MATMPPEAMPPEAMPAEPQMDADQMPNATPEEQKVYDLFVQKAAEFIYTEKGEVEPIPGKTMPAVTVVERDYPNTFARFTARASTTRAATTSASSITASCAMRKNTP